MAPDMFAINEPPILSSANLRSGFGHGSAKIPVAFAATSTFFHQTSS